MKRFLLVLLAAAISFSVFAQTESEHLTFKGIPIDGPLKSFVAQLQSKGFMVENIKDESAVLKGDFAGYDDCYIVVYTVQNKDLVSHVAVMLPEGDKWSSLESDYQKLKRMLTSKYGEPAEVVEEFQHSYAAVDNSSKLHELQMNRCTFKSIFITEKGNIGVLINHSDYLNCRVYLGYYDSINGLIAEEAAMDDL